MLELTVIPTSKQSIKIIDEADSFVIGEKEYALRLPFYPNHNEVIELIEYIKNNNQRVYLAVNKIIHEYELEQITAYLKEMAGYPIDGFIFGDLAIYPIAKQLGIVDRLIYNPETYITNYASTHFFNEKGIKRISIAKEITLEDIKTIGQEANIELDILGHGAVSMFHSKRELVTNYFRYLKDEKPETHHNEPLYIVERRRQEEKYPIIEDQNGTHIFNEADLSTIEYLDEWIENNITSIRIDGLFKTDQELSSIVKVYRMAINDYMKDPELYRKNKPYYTEQLTEIEGIRPFNTGFLFKKTVYKG